MRLLRELGERARPHPDGARPGREPWARPSKSLYWHTFGSLTTALREAGFDVPVGEERLERALDQGAGLAKQLGRLPKFDDWKAARREDGSLLSEWQIYRMFEGRRGAWAAFQFLVQDGSSRKASPSHRTDGWRRQSGSVPAREAPPLGQPRTPGTDPQD